MSRVHSSAVVVAELPMAPNVLEEDVVFNTVCGAAAVHVPVKELPIGTPDIVERHALI